MVGSGVMGATVMGGASWGGLEEVEDVEVGRAGFVIKEVGREVGRAQRRE